MSRRFSRNVRKNTVRSFATREQANWTFNTFWAITTVFGLVVIVVGFLTVAGSFSWVIGVPVVAGSWFIASKAGAIQHDAWLRVTPAHVVREEGFEPLTLSGRPRR